MKRPPKKYECTHCGFISNRHKTLNFGWIGFAVCFKCRGKLKEREDWLEWLHKEQHLTPWPKALKPTE